MSHVFLNHFTQFFFNKKYIWKYLQILAISFSEEWVNMTNAYPNDDKFVEDVK